MGFNLFCQNDDVCCDKEMSKVPCVLVCVILSIISTCVTHKGEKTFSANVENENGWKCSPQRGHGDVYWRGDMCVGGL